MPARARSLAASLSIALALAVVACESPTAPVLPAGAVPYAPNPEMVAVWWQQVENCSGHSGDLRTVRFYIVPDASTFEWESRDVIGLWMARGNRIVLASAYAFRESNVRHEMLHALIRLPGHPPEYFVERCGTLVDHSPMQ